MLLLLVLPASFLSFSLPLFLPPSLEVMNWSYFVETKRNYFALSVLNVTEAANSSSSIQAQSSLDK